MKNEIKFNKRPYAENKLAASYEILRTFQNRGRTKKVKKFF